MILKFGDFLITVWTTSESSIVSKHTGLNLIKKEVNATIEGSDLNENFLELIKNAKENSIQSVDENGNAKKTWKLKNTSWSYRDGETIYRHTIILEEVEELKLDYLDIDGFIVTPYVYQEDFEYEEMKIDSKAVLSEVEHNKLRTMMKNHDSFLVTRFGINETPIKMHFGLSYWSKHEDKYKHKIFLIEDQEGKTSNNLTSAFQWIHKMRSFVIENKTTINALLEVLVAKKILTSEDIENIRKEAIEHTSDVHFEFFKVNDIDEM